MATANERLRSRVVAHSLYIERYKRAVYTRLQRFLDRVEQDIVRQLQRRSVSGDFTARRLELLLAAVADANSAGFQKFRDALRREVRALAKYEVEFQAELMQSVSGVVADLGVVAPTAATVYTAVFSRPFAGRLLRQWASGLERATLVKVQEAVRIGVAEGETVDQIVRRVRGTRALRYRDGAMEISRRNAQAVVRTAINHTVTRAREELYQANADLVKGVQWVSTLDTRTTEICMARDGKVFPLDSGPRPPAHFGCRSTTVPVLKSWKELGINLKESRPGTRASMNGQVAGTMTYGEWLRAQPRAVQEEALGREKARLFREGGLSVDRFVDRTGRPYTLEELREREAAAFRAIDPD